MFFAFLFAISGAKKRRPISTNGLAMDWTDEEEEEETCDVCGGQSSSVV